MTTELLAMHAMVILAVKTSAGYQGVVLDVTTGTTLYRTIYSYVSAPEAEGVARLWLKTVELRA